MLRAKPRPSSPTTTPQSAIVTLLAPLKHIAALKLSKLAIFVGSASPLKNLRPKLLVSSEPEPIPLPIPLPPTPGEILEQIGGNLRQLREQHQLSIEDISARTQIQPRLIRALEEGHIEMLPESVYVKGLIKRYANSLGLDGMAISQQVPKWEPESATFEPVTKMQMTGFHAAIRIKPSHVYLGYALAIVGICAGTSQLLNNALRPPATVEVAVIPPRQPVGIVIKNSTFAKIWLARTTKFTGNVKVGTQLNWLVKKPIPIDINNVDSWIGSGDSKPPKPLAKIRQKRSVNNKVRKY